MRSSRHTVSIALCILWLLSGCTGRHYAPELSLADSLLDFNPTAGIILLDSIKDHLPAPQEANQMYYQLLSIKAADKTDKLKPDTTEILHLIDYFQSSGSSPLPTAYYYAGRTYYELHDMPQALEYFQNAVDAIGDRKGRFLQLKQVCYSQMGYIFLYQKLLDEAQEMFKRSIECALQIDDTLGLAYGYRDLATTLSAKSNYQEANSTLKTALLYSERAKANSITFSIESYMANNYRHLKEYDSALIHIRPALSNIFTQDSSAIYSNIANIYFDKGSTDSALHYIHLVEKMGKVYSKRKAYKQLLDIAIDRRDFRNLPDYWHYFILFSDSIENMTQTDAVARIQALYNFQKKEKENFELKQVSNRRLIIIFCIIIISLFLWGLSYLILQQYRRRQAILTKRLKEAERLKEDSYRKSLEYIKKNEAIIGELSLRLKLADINNSELTKKLKRERERLISSNKIAEIGLVEKEKARQSVMDSNIYRKFAAMSICEHPKNEDWNDLEQLLNTESDNFCEKLKSICKLTEIKYRLSLLIKLELEPSQIANLLNTSRSNVSTIRSRLYKDAFGKKGSSKDWDEFIKSL